MTISLPIFPISFYDGEWIDFAQGADWSFLTNSNAMDITREVELHWGPMVSEMVMLFNPDGPDQSEPPDLVAPLSTLEYNYLPLMLK